MPKHVLESFEEFVNFYEINEEIITDDKTYDFVCNGNDISTDGPNGGPSPGFKDLAEIKQYSNAGYFNQTSGFDKGMTLEQWSKTDGYKKCEANLLKRAYGDMDIKVLGAFKNKHPEQYIAAVLYFTHEPMPKRAARGVDRYSPFGSGGGSLFLGKRKGNLSAIDKSTAEKIIKDDPKKAPETNSQPISFQIPEKVDTSGFFPFNSWTLSQEFKDYLKKELIDPTKEAMKNATPVNPKDPKAFLEELTVDASCSTIPNKTSPEDKKIHTYKELADLRANSAVDYIKEELGKIGVLVDKDTKITITSDGENKGKKVTKAYGNLAVGTNLTGTSGPEWDGKNTEDLKKFQKIGVSGKLLINTSRPKIPEDNKPDPTVRVIPGKDEFRLEATFGKPKIRFEIPEINIRIPRIGIFDFLKKERGIPCPKFPSGGY